MISEAEFVTECRKVGTRGHFSRGVWWREPYVLYAKPMYEFREIIPGDAGPLRKRALFGYSHHVPGREMANYELDYMILRGDTLRGYDIGRLDGYRRNRVRKGLRCCEVRVVTDFERNIRDLQEIYVSQSRRHSEHHERPETPPEYYVANFDNWATRERTYLSHAGRRLWGAFARGKMVGCIVTLEVEGSWFIEKVKSHTEYMGLCPVDALYVTVLEEAGRTASCVQVVNPGIRGGRLARHKEKFLFEQTSVPIYLSRPRLFRLGQAVFRALRAARR